MRLTLAALAVLLLTGCGGPSPNSATPRATSRPVPSATPTPGPDVERLDITAKGIGAYMLVAVPVVIVHNAASRTTAGGVVVHFRVLRGGRQIFTLDSPAVQVFPGQSLVITANCTDTCNSADGVDATVTASRWTVVGGGPIATDPGSYSCGGGCGGHGYGSVTTALHGGGLVLNTPVNAFAACVNAAGAIVGGGQRQLTWPQNGGSLTLTVPVIVSARPASCSVGASAPSTTS